MVRAAVWHTEEEDLPGGHSDGAGTQTQDVQFPGMERSENSLQKVRNPVFFVLWDKLVVDKAVLFVSPF